MHLSAILSVPSKYAVDFMLLIYPEYVRSGMTDRNSVDDVSSQYKETLWYQAVHALNKKPSQRMHAKFHCLQKRWCHVSRGTIFLMEITAGAMGTLSEVTSSCLVASTILYIFFFLSWRFLLASFSFLYGTEAGEFKHSEICFNQFFFT